MSKREHGRLAEGEAGSPTEARVGALTALSDTETDGEGDEWAGGALSTLSGRENDTRRW